MTTMNVGRESEFVRLIRILQETFHDQGVAIWLQAINRDLGYQRPLDEIRAGNIAIVLKVAERIEGAS